MIVCLNESEVGVEPWTLRKTVKVKVSNADCEASRRDRHAADPRHDSGDWYIYTRTFKVTSLESLSDLFRD